MDIDEYKSRCYICWDSDDLIRCYQCNYGVCARCLVKDDRFSTVVPKLCRHDECAYNYMEQDEIDKQNCFVCSRQAIFIEYRCGMCVANSEIAMKSVIDAIEELALELERDQGFISKEATIVNQKIVFYTLKDLDTGGVELNHFWEIQQPPSNRDEIEAPSDYLINQT